MSLAAVGPIGHKPAPKAPNLRAVLADARIRIATADRQNDPQSLAETRDTLARLAVYFQVHGGGSVHDVAIVSDLANDHLRDVIARRAIENNPYRETAA